VLPSQTRYVKTMKREDYMREPWMTFMSTAISRP
jgi:hypothetical protein